MKRKLIPVFCLLFLAACLAGCVGQASASRTEAVTLLQATREDLRLIDRLIADEDLGLMEEDSSDSGEMTAEDIDFYQDVLNGYIKDIGSRLKAMRARPVSANAELAAFQKAVQDEFELAASVLDELTQTLRYAGAMLDLGEKLGAMGNVDTTDNQAAYTAISEVLKQAEEGLKNSGTPSFLKSMNDHLIESLQEMDGAVGYALASAEMGDPVRGSAAVYRMGIVERKLTKISADADSDTQTRMEKLKGDAQRIKETNDGLEAWVLDNLRKLGAN